ncbi:MAG TPA: hypothetical protein VK816_02860 [Jatrophihabitantaceae bacterium]|jgi:hypothetical protein|nr:hypothetical protein [Jatrophihabitantaceae bacterium]
MKIGASLFLVALGAILRFAVHVTNTHGFNIGTAGLILMIVGAVGLVITGLLMSTRQRTDVVHRSRTGEARTTYLEPRDTVEPN